MVATVGSADELSAGATDVECRMLLGRDDGRPGSVASGVDDVEELVMLVSRVSVDKLSADTEIRKIEHSPAAGTVKSEGNDLVVECEYVGNCDVSVTNEVGAAESVNESELRSLAMVCKPPRMELYGAAPRVYAGLLMLER